MAARTFSTTLTGADTRLQAGLAALFVGALLVFGVGLAHSSALHEAAHDTRHAYGFPCH
ncbi:CbtB domain-containing protein [Pseudohoeflea coraliihabitans]|uniref:CbtB-domain containing protein n=1 Tax=Pseudohoeflea coraliihabitans TaxID=2860393 RepID=A0ABS6WKY5_9HYPH|nr:CbtB-domain containing protein [Pseudohoeflea sp. DP4N28-3]MBW3095759.1 CbtB-domain containing protein [Pseudohoeflea sp. DP4N28-3]